MALGSTYLDYGMIMADRTSLCSTRAIASSPGIVSLRDSSKHDNRSQDEVVRRLVEPRGGSGTASTARTAQKQSFIDITGSHRANASTESFTYSLQNYHTATVQYAELLLCISTENRGVVEPRGY